MQEFVSTALAVHMPRIMRWAGGIAKLLRQHQISLEGKASGSAGTDALTLADLTLQELLVAALRDSDPIFRHCRIDAEESTGDLAAFPETAPLTIGIDPIDGTRKYRDHAGNGYSVMLHLRTGSTVVYSLVYIPEQEAAGWWVEVNDGRIVSGPDDPRRPAEDVLRSLPAVNPVPSAPKTYYVNGFRDKDPEAARRVRETGLHSLTSDQLPGCPYELIARGDLAGALLHSPNLYDFPVIMQMTQLLGGQCVFVENGQAVHFRDPWLDPKARMLRVRGIVACSSDVEDLRVLCDLARNWNQDRYQDSHDL